MAKKKTGKTKYWVGVGYTENMRDDWETVIGDELDGLPCAYCIHPLDVNAETGELKKKHAHFIVVFNGNTTYNHALETFRRLDKSEDVTAFNTVKPCLNVRGAYNYLIHDTESARKQGKYLYDESERVCVNGFDVTAYEHDDDGEIALYAEMCHFIMDNEITTIDVFIEEYDPFRDTKRAKVYMARMAQFDRLTTAVWKHSAAREREDWKRSFRDASDVAQGDGAGGGSTTTPPPVTSDKGRPNEEVQVDEVTSSEDETTSPAEREGVMKTPEALAADNSYVDGEWTKYFTGAERPRKIYLVLGKWLEIVDEHGDSLTRLDYGYSKQELLEAWKHGDVALPTLTEREARELHDAWHPSEDAQSFASYLEEQGKVPKDFLLEYKRLAELEALESLGKDPKALVKACQRVAELEVLKHVAEAAFSRTTEDGGGSLGE